MAYGLAKPIIGLAFWNVLRLSLTFAAGHSSSSHVLRLAPPFAAGHSSSPPSSLVLTVFSHLVLFVSLKNVVRRRPSRSLNRMSGRKILNTKTDTLPFCHDPRK